MDWEIQAWSGQCKGCQSVFRDGDDFHCFLILSAEGLPMRNDFCQSCFIQAKASWTVQPEPCPPTNSGKDEKAHFETHSPGSGTTGDQQTQTGIGRGVYSYWRGKIRIEPLPPRRPSLPYERFELVLRRVIVSKELRDRKFAYILMLILERKKILIHRESRLDPPTYSGKDEKAHFETHSPGSGTTSDQQTQTGIDGGARRYLVYEHSQTGESFILEDPHLSLSQVADFERELKEMMDREFYAESCEPS